MNNGNDFEHEGQARVDGQRALAKAIILSIVVIVAGTAVLALLAT
jgi:hypothetical protein